MKLPLFIKIILNIIFYIIYVLFVTITTSFVLPLLFNFFVENGSSISNMIQFIIIVIVLFITTVYRKYFYISLESKKSESELNKTDVKTKKFNDLKKDELDILIAKEK
jgi:ABC-type multidrug transport system fused ATPase/permease subunit